MPPRVTDVGMPVGPFVTPGTGEITPAWRAFLLGLHARTGGNIGTDTRQLQQQITDEAQTRAAADLTLTAGLAREVINRSDADNVEIEARREGDAGLQSQIKAETQSRQIADNKMVPRAQLCTMWAACDLAFLPTTDPGHGAPWLMDGRVMVGAGPAGSYIGLEDGSGVWTLELGGDWLYG